MRRFVMLILLLFFLLTQGIAEPSLPYDRGTVLSASPLSYAQRLLMNHLYEPIMAHQEEIDLPEGTAYEDARVALNTLMQDYPETFHLGSSYTITYDRMEPDIALSLKPSYRLSYTQAVTLREELMARVQQLLSQTTDPLLLHDLVGDLAVYDLSADLCDTAPGALLYGRASCEGYSEALTLLYRCAGIPCGIVTGYAANSTGEMGRHAWMVADVGGMMYLDPTWDDQERVNTHWYYGLSAQEMAQDHTPEYPWILPAAEEALSWHEAAGMVVTEEADLYPLLPRLARGEALNLRLSPELYQLFLQDANALITRYNQTCAPEDRFYDGCTLLFSDTQHCLILTPAGT